MKIFKNQNIDDHLVLNHDDEVLKNIEKEEKYAVEASIGTYTTIIDGKTSCQECIRLSDMEMYRNKRIKKKGRAE